MKKTILQRYLIIILMAIVFAPLGMAQEKNLYSFTVKAIDGSDLALSVFQGKKVLIVNVASKCGLTPQYEKLQALYEKYGDKDFVILGFPANNFGAQEPGTNEEIFAFCTSTYQVAFPMMSKISVKGEDMAPLYKWLTQKEWNGKQDAPVTWNFQKFMIDEKGNWVGFAEPKTDPFAEKIVEWIEKGNIKD